MFVKINDVFKKAAIISFSNTFRLILGIETTSLLEYLLLLMSLYDNKKSTNCISKHDDESGLNRNVKLGHLKVKLAASKAGGKATSNAFSRSRKPTPKLEMPPATPLINIGLLSTSQSPAQKSHLQ